MKPLMNIARGMLAAEPRAFLRGAVLGLLVLAMGAALLGLSGWFVTACAVAGIVGIGIDFDFFRPSAGVRLLALGRAGARYGERMLTHDATLRSLSSLRLRLYKGVAHLPHDAQNRLRGAEALNRMTSDVDALDGLLLRLMIPAVSVGAIMVIAAVMLSWLVAPVVAAAVIAAYVFGGGVALALTARRANSAAQRAETALQDLRAKTLDMAQSRADLIVAGALIRHRVEIDAAIAREVSARDQMEIADRKGGFALSLTTSLAAAAALAVGGQLAMDGTITAAEAAIGFFVAIALGEGPMLLRRGLSELGRMQVAARRVDALVSTPLPSGPDIAPVPEPGPLVAVDTLTHRRTETDRATFAPISFTVSAGETLLISGPSGAGKTTLLGIIAGLLPPTTGTVAIMGQPLGAWPEPALRDILTMVPQRSALIGGTIADNLALALPDGTDPDVALDLLHAMRLDAIIDKRQGLQTRLGAGGSGLSGGQARRLVLARAVLRKPQILLLDEPTEGLDHETATATFGAIRNALPDAAIIFVSHRPSDCDFATKRFHVTQQ